MTNNFRKRYHKNIKNVNLINYLSEFNTYKNYSINNIKK